MILALSVCYQTGYENMGLLQSREIFCAGQRQPSHQQRGLIGVVVEVKPSTLYPVVKLMPQTCLLSIVVRVGVKLSTLYPVVKLLPQTCLLSIPVSFSFCILCLLSVEETFGDTNH